MKVLELIIKVLRSRVARVIKKKTYTLIGLRSKSDIEVVLKILKNSSLYRCKVLNHITGVDYVGYSGVEKKMYMYYCIRSMAYNHQIVIEVEVEEWVSSVSEIYESSVWFEREVYDMYGIWFKKHPDLRRILTDYGFKHNPLRKDFPVTGFKEIRYDDRTNSLLSEEIELAQLPKPKQRC